MVNRLHDLGTMTIPERDKINRISLSLDKGLRLFIWEIQYLQKVYDERTK